MVRPVWLTRLSDRGTGIKDWSDGHILHVARQQLKLGIIPCHQAPGIDCTVVSLAGVADIIFLRMKWNLKCEWNGCNPLRRRRCSGDWCLASSRGKCQIPILSLLVVAYFLNTSPTNYLRRGKNDLSPFALCLIFTSGIAPKSVNLFQVKTHCQSLFARIIDFGCKNTNYFWYAL